MTQEQPPQEQEQALQDSCFKVIHAFDPFDFEITDEPTTTPVNEEEEHILTRLIRAFDHHHDDDDCCEHDDDDKKQKMKDFKGRIIHERQGEQKRQLLRQYAEDYGHIVHQVPRIVFVPCETSDVALLVQFLFEFNNQGQKAKHDDVVEHEKKKKGRKWRIQLVVRGAGGNVCGASQVLPSNKLSSLLPTKDDESNWIFCVLLDMSHMNRVLLDDDCPSQPTHDEKSKEKNSPSQSVWVEAGCTWLQVLRATSKRYGMRPRTIPDYLNLTVGGTVAIGGFGGDNIKHGPCIDNVEQLEVVLGDGRVVICSRTEHKELFCAVRGGMGQFGVITKLKLELEPHDAMTRVYHFVFEHVNDLLDSMNVIYDEFVAVDNKNELNTRGGESILTLQTFVMANQVGTIQAMAMSGNTSGSQCDEAIEQLASKASEQKWVYMLELSTRFGTDEAQHALTVQAINDKLGEEGNRGIKALIYAHSDMDTLAWDDRLNLVTIPFLNHIGSWSKRHCWLNIIFTEHTARHYLQETLNGLDLMKDQGGGHIGFYPLRRDVCCRNNESFLSYPNISHSNGEENQGKEDEWVYLMCLGRDEQTGSDEGLNFQMNSNRAVWEKFSQSSSFENNLVHASLYPTNFIPGWCTIDWQKQYGVQLWSELKKAKAKFDPENIFADVRSMGLVSQK